MQVTVWQSVFAPGHWVGDEHTTPLLELLDELELELDEDELLALELEAALLELELELELVVTPLELLDVLETALARIPLVELASPPVPPRPVLELETAAPPKLEEETDEAPPIPPRPVVELDTAAPPKPALDMEEELVTRPLEVEVAPPPPTRSGP